MPVSRALRIVFSALVCVVFVATLGGVARGASPVLQSAFQSYRFDPQAIAPIRIADLDHVGTTEVVSGATDTHNNFFIIVSKLVSNTWQRVQTIAAGTAPPTFVTSDVNHDGFPDLVYLRDGTLFARVNDGTGSFGTEQPLAGSGTPPTDLMQTLLLFHRAQTGDEFFALTLSGAFVIFRDSVESNGTHDYVEVSREENAGLYETFIDNGLPYGLPPVAAEADLNGDGMPDVAAFTEPGLPNSTRPGVRLFMGAANGTYASPVDLYLDDSYARSEFIYAVDVDGDGDTDLVLGQEDTEVTVFLNDGAGNLTQSTSVQPYFGPTNDPTVHGVPVDVNGDGRADYLVEIVDHLNLTLVFDLYGNLLHQLPSGISPYAVATGDVDGDGTPDVAVLGQHLPITLDVYLGRGGDHFGDALQTVTLPESPVGVAVGDLDSDGTPDLALVGFQDLTTVLSTSPTLATPYALPLSDVGTDVAIGVGAGAQAAAVEVVTTLSSHQPVRFPSMAGGVLGVPSLFDGSTGEEVAVATGDLNGDHRYDIAAAILEGGRDSVIVWLSNASGFQPPLEYAVGSYVRDIAIADVNGDGAPDIVTANNPANSVSVLLNQGNGAMGAATDTPIPGDLSPTSLAIGSLVGNDEFPDVAVAIPDANEVFVFQGDGHGALAPLGAYAVEAGPGVVRAGDVDADGNTDLVTANSAANTVSVLAGTKVGSQHSLADAASFGVCQAPKDIALGNFSHHADGRLDVIAIGNRTVPSPAPLSATRPTAVAASTEWDLFYLPSGPPATASATPTTRTASLEMLVAPNPARELAELTFALPSAGRATVDVFDLTGRRVARLADGGFVAGTHRVQWNGRDGANRRVAAGVFAGAPHDPSGERDAAGGVGEVRGLEPRSTGHRERDSRCFQEAVRPLAPVPQHRAPRPLPVEKFV